MSEFVTSDQQFLSVFGAWFTVDDIDLRDCKVLKSRAGVCASDLAKKYPDIDRLIGDLLRTLDNWSPQIAMEFVDATNVDWLFDDATEEILRDILREVVDALRYFRERQVRG